MGKGLLAKRIPTILGLLVLGGGLISGILLVSQRQGLGIKAGPTSQPKNVKLANVTATGFVISWTTDVPVTGFLKYSDNPAKLSLPAGDSRDQVAGSVSPYTTHYVEVTGLSPDKTYYFTIGTGSQTYDDNGKPYQVRTFVAATPPAEDVVSGKIINTAGAGVSGAIVYVEVTGSNTLTALTKSDGSYRLTLSDARDSSGKYLTYDLTKEQETVLVQAGAEGTATAITNTETDNPVPDINLGKTHNFIGGSVTPAPLSSLGNVESSGFGGLSQAAAIITQSPEATYSVKLINPASEGERLATRTPEFIGTAPVGTTIKLILQSVIQVGYATASATGNWAWSPPDSIEVGNHTLTIQYTDALGVLQTLSRSFVVLAAGDMSGLPAFTSTPSGTPTATPSGTITPTLTLTPTTAPIPDAGVLTPTTTLLIVGLGLFFSGIIWRKWLLGEESDN